MKPTIKSVVITEDMLEVVISDGRIISTPLAWYPRLIEADIAVLNNFRLIGNGSGIHWDQIDEDLSLNGMLLGIPGSREKVA
jgi:Protein of unknown function (DUF2442)